VTSVVQGASVSAALFTGLGATDTIGQLSKSLLTSAGIADFGKTSVASLLALSRPSVDVLVATGLGYSQEAWTRAAMGALIRPEQDSVGVGFLSLPTTSRSCVYDESSQRRDRFVCRLVLTTIATSYLPIAALVALASHIKRWVPRPRMRRARWTSPAADSTPRRRRPCVIENKLNTRPRKILGRKTSTEVYGLAI
jgi:hypothetical protein